MHNERVIAIGKSGYRTDRLFEAAHAWSALPLKADGLAFVTYVGNGPATDISGAVDCLRARVSYCGYATGPRAQPMGETSTLARSPACLTRRPCRRVLGILVAGKSHRIAKQ